VWDVLFYKQTLMPKPPQRVFKFPSDIVLSKHPETRKEWKEFAQRGGQDHWNEVSGGHPAVAIHLSTITR
jgi:hypothetical protein